MQLMLCRCWKEIIFFSAEVILITRTIVIFRSARSPHFRLGFSSSSWPHPLSSAQPLPLSSAKSLLKPWRNLAPPPCRFPSPSPSRSSLSPSRSLLPLRRSSLSTSQSLLPLRRSSLCLSRLSHATVSDKFDFYGISIGINYPISLAQYVIYTSVNFTNPRWIHTWN